MFNIDKIFEIICGLDAVSGYAYDVHYAAKGRFFYSDHLFSERLGDKDEFAEIKDDLIETVYLGRGYDAPNSADISYRVAEITPKISGNSQENFKRLRDMIVSLLVNIESLDDLTRGEEDLFGSLAHVLQRHNGLLFRQLDYTMEEFENASDEDVEWITVKGNHIPIPKGASGEEKKKAIDEFFRKKGKQSRSKKDAQAVFSRARGFEPKITKDVTSMAKKLGVENLGLDFRLKTEKSALRKAKDEREKNPSFKSDKHALNSMWDIVRYTQGGTAKDVVSKGIETLKELQNKGYKVYQIKNYWLDKNSPYKGINVKVLSPDNQKFEMQFNTAHNIDVKEEMHKYYELEREEKNEAKRKEYHDKMMEISKRYEPVSGFENFTYDNVVSKSSNKPKVSKVINKVESYRGRSMETYSLTDGKERSYNEGYSVTFHQNEPDEKGGYKSHMGRYSDDEYDSLTNKIAEKYGADVNVGVFDDEPEISFHIKNLNDATRLMKKYNQHSIWDWKRGKLIVNKRYDPKKNPMKGD